MWSETGGSTCGERKRVDQAVERGMKWKSPWSKGLKWSNLRSEEGSGLECGKGREKVCVYSVWRACERQQHECQQDWKASSAVTMINGVKLHRTKQLKSIQVERSRNKDILLILVFGLNYVFSKEKKRRINYKYFI